MNAGQGSGPAAPQPPDPDPGIEPEQGFIRELSQFFIVPSLIVLLCVGIFIMFGLISSETKSARDFLQEVRTARGPERWQAAFEMSRVIAQQPQLRADDGLVNELIEVIREEGRQDPRIRKYMIVALEHLRNRAAGPAIIEALGDPEPEVRLQAARALGVIESVPGAAGPLAELMMDDDPAVRKVAIFALGQTRDRAAIPALLPRLDDPLVDIRWNAALALAVLGDASGRGVIAQMLDRDQLDAIEGITEEQKINAIINGVQAVYLLHDVSLKEKVRRLSESDPSLKVRNIAIQALRALEEAPPG